MDHTRLRAPLGETLVRQYWTTLKSGNMSQLEMWCAKGFSPLIGVEWTYLAARTSTCSALASASCTTSVSRSTMGEG
jgi:hypothetical protein